MIVLAVDTAAAACSVAIRRDEAVLAWRRRPMRRGHAEALMPMVLEALDEAGLGFADIDLYGVTLGPGAFTGLRIGLAAVGGMALASGRGIVGVTSFEAVAAGVPAAAAGPARLLVALDSKREDLFVQLFDAGHRPLGEPAGLPPAALPGWIPPGPLLVAGDAAPRAAEALAGHPGLRLAEAPPLADPARVAALAAAHADRAQVDPPAPLYLRPPDATPAAEQPRP